jgi:hypothetical protein
MVCLVHRSPHIDAHPSADLWGRGYSDAPDAKHDTALYTSQLALLMQHVGWASACIAGVSMVRPSPPPPSPRTC